MDRFKPAKIPKKAKPFSNEQIIYWSFGDRAFVSGRGIFFINCPAIAEKNKEIVGQKIIDEMVELLFTRSSVKRLCSRIFKTLALRTKLAKAKATWELEHYG